MNKFKNQKYFAQSGYNQDSCDNYKSLLNDMKKKSIFEFYKGRAEEIKLFKASKYYIFLTNNYIVMYNTTDNGDTTSVGCEGYIAERTKENEEIFLEWRKKTKETSSNVFTNCMLEANTKDEQLKNLNRLLFITEKTISSLEHRKFTNQHIMRKREEYYDALNKFIYSLEKSNEAKEKDKYINILKWFDDIDWKDNDKY